MHQNFPLGRGWVAGERPNYTECFAGPPEIEAGSRRHATPSAIAAPWVLNHSKLIGSQINTHGNVPDVFWSIYKWLH